MIAASNGAPRRSAPLRSASARLHRRRPMLMSAALVNSHRDRNAKTGRPRSSSTAAAVAAGMVVARPAGRGAGGRDRSGPHPMHVLCAVPRRPDARSIANAHVEAAQIEEDLAKLARLTGCVRTYSTDTGLDQVPAIAQRLGMKVLQGLWLGGDRAEEPHPRSTPTVALAKRYPRCRSSASWSATRCCCAANCRRRTSRRSCARSRPRRRCR